ncbi:MAG: hydroxypyruvate isomerase family protein, partial [Blastocatellia bacterium]
ATAGPAIFAQQPQAPAADYTLEAKHLTPLRLKGRIRQSTTRGPYRRVKFADLCQAAKAMGLVGIDLVSDRNDWPTLKQYGLIATMVPGAGRIPDGFNRRENHDWLEKDLRANAAAAAQAGWKNVITFSGNRKGLPDGEGLENCVIGLNRIRGIAEEFNVTVCMELLNSRVNHPDYQFDHMAWGLELMKRVNHPRIKILYDIYHAQIMDGDIIRTIREHIQWIAHFHTGGVPGRHELDDSQELQWRTIMRAIADLNFTGVVAHEFSPTKPDPLDSLREAVLLCDV